MHFNPKKKYEGLLECIDVLILLLLKKKKHLNTNVIILKSGKSLVEIGETNLSFGNTIMRRQVEQQCKSSRFTRRTSIHILARSPAHNKPLFSSKNVPLSTAQPTYNTSRFHTAARAAGQLQHACRHVCSVRQTSIGVPPLKHSGSTRWPIRPRPWRFPNRRQPGSPRLAVLQQDAKQPRCGTGTHVIYCTSSSSFLRFYMKCRDLTWCMVALSPLSWALAFRRVRVSSGGRQRSMVGRH